MGHPRSQAQAPASHCPQCKPFPLDSPWAEADVISLVLMLSPTPSAQDPYTGLSESGPKVTSTMVQSRLFWCCPEPASNIRLEEPHQMAVSTNHNLGGHVIQLRSYLIDIIRKIIGGFRVIAPFTTIRGNTVIFFQVSFTFHIYQKYKILWYFHGYKRSRHFF